ncbi:MAG: phosphoribosyl-AMP cyclohydrolase [Cyclobacteriaceae bacterium]|nr:phosphoribosyl-AMP cyclohydrolase [Cyclobacteriaceae bacterium]MCH8517094.1 phosphoribosyl-AMP cyclohydrolase [Cyclobacteriaceae bacterium]
MITKEDIKKAQKKWADAIINIGRLKKERDICEKTTNRLLEELYAFDSGSIAFKPTKTSQCQFRHDKESALSYFIGGNRAYPEDGGFAINTPWTKVEFENDTIILEENRALAMGNYYFTNEIGQVTKVEYTFGYKKTTNGELKIDLHHSSIPYSPEKVYS